MASTSQPSPPNKMSDSTTLDIEQSPKPGLFRFYKSGQGYWTRLGTALGAGAVVCFVAWFIYAQSVTFVENRTVRLGLAGGFVALMAVVVWWLMNGANRAQFLIDTDSEMKKVSWSTWPDLIGSTRVVVFFMIATAITLFVFDTQFHATFFGLKVWQVPFDSLAGLITGCLLGLALLGVGVGLTRSPDGGRSKWIGVLLIVVSLAIIVGWAVLYQMNLLPTLAHTATAATPG